MNSLYYPFIDTNEWAVNTPYLSSAQLFSPFSIFYWNTSQLLFPFNRSYSSSSQLDLLVNTSYLETNRSNLSFIGTNASNGLWYWPTPPPYWAFGLGNPALIYELLNSGNTKINTPSPEEIDFYHLWQKIAEAIENGLPRTAIEHLKEMVPLAIEGGKYGMAMKGICKQLVLEANIQGNKPEEKITRLTEEIESAPEALKPLLNLVLAQWYWQYYQSNRWRFSQRDTNADIIDTDFTTWDLRRLLDKIYFKRA